MLLFFGTGSVIYTYFSSHNPADNGIPQVKFQQPADPNFFLQTVSGRGNASLNQLTIYFISKTMPMGLVGLILAAIFAATQSTVSSGLQALSNSIAVDFIKRFNTRISDRVLTYVSKGLVALFGAFGIGFAILLQQTGQRQFFDYFTGIVGVLNGPTIAIFVLGLYTRKTESWGATTGAIVASLIAIPI